LDMAERRRIWEAAEAVENAEEEGGVFSSH
jgi:hypothetical protein